MSKTEIMAKLTAGEIDVQEAATLLAGQMVASGANVTMKVSEKGCITFRGLPGANVRYGFSPRKETLEWLYANREKVEAFLEKNKAEIAERSAASRAARKAA